MGSLEQNKNKRTSVTSFLIYSNHTINVGTYSVEKFDFYTINVWKKMACLDNHQYGQD